MRYSKNKVEGFDLKGIVKDVIFVGSQYRTLITLDNGHEIKINSVKRDKEIKEGDHLFIYWDLEDAIAIKDIL